MTRRRIIEIFITAGSGVRGEHVARVIRDLLAEPVVRASFARKPSTMTSWPILSASFVMPRRISCPGAPPENAQFVTVPSGLLTST
jgi:hypothetical protein